MAEDRLPENPEDWPSNPFEVLGIPFDADSAAIRKAYRDLIHQYKPERAPEQFRRIREAYERVRQQNPRRLAMPRFSLGSVDAMFSTEPEANPPRKDVPDGQQPNPDPAPDGSAAPDHRPPSADDPPKPPRPRLDLRAEIRAAWELALAGQPKEAYERLAELSLGVPLNDEIASRRYWLIRLAPEVKPGRRAVEELYPVVQSLGLNGVVGQLYLAEITRDADEALSERCAALMGDLRNARWRRPLQRVRWRAAAKNNLWHIIDSDLERLRGDHPLDPIPWLWGHVDLLKVCLGASSGAAQERAAASTQILNEEVDWSRETQVIEAEAETVQRLLAESESPGKWQQFQFSVGDMPRIPWEELASFRVAGPIDPRCLRLRLEPLLAAWSRDVFRGLKQLDLLFHHFPGHAVELCRLISDELFEGLGVESTLSGEELRQTMLLDMQCDRRLRHLSTGPSLAEFRRGILCFCVEEQVDLEPVIEVLSQLMPNLPWDSEFHPLRLESDDALQTVVRGCLALWEEPARVMS